MTTHLRWWVVGLLVCLLPGFAHAEPPQVLAAGTTQLLCPENDSVPHLAESAKKAGMEGLAFAASARGCVFGLLQAPFPVVSEEALGIATMSGEDWAMWMLGIESTTGTVLWLLWRERTIAPKSHYIDWRNPRGLLGPV